MFTGALEILPKRERFTQDEVKAISTWLAANNLGHLGSGDTTGFYSVFLNPVARSA